MPMNIYDFDGTIYQGDSSADFAKYCFVHKPKCLKKLPKIIKATVLYAGKKTNTKKFKEAFFSFLNVLTPPELNTLLYEFWRKKRKKIAPWYVEKKRNEDVIISASPRFLLEPVMELIGNQNLIATKMDSQTGCIEGENCKGEEKVRLFRKAFPNCSVDEFYSDSLSDMHLAKLAKTAFFVEGDKLKEWPQIHE